MTIQAAFTMIVNQLTPIQGEREATSIAHILMEDITGMGKMDRIVYKDKLLTPEQSATLDTALSSLLANKPVQYVIGKAWFYGMELQVDEHVLIPRPETEELVEWIIQDDGDNKRILDIGTGSGAIPLALKKELKRAQVHAIDVSPGALAVAKGNGVKLGLDVQFHQMDVLDPQATSSLPAFNIIVSNPPYICEAEGKDMQEEVLAYEPGIALFVPDEDPLLFYRAIGLLAQEKLTRGGALYFEINEAYGKEVVALLEAQGYVQVELRKDLFDKDRMVKGVKF